MTKEQLKPLSKDEKAEEGRKGMRRLFRPSAIDTATRRRRRSAAIPPAVDRRRSITITRPSHGVCRPSPVSSSIRICLIAEEKQADDEREEEEEEMDASAVALPLHSASRKK